MFILPLLILGMTGCGPGGDGLGEVRSTDDAPWSMDAASTFICSSPSIQLTQTTSDGPKMAVPD